MRLLISLILLFSFSPYVGALTSLDRAELSFPNSLQDSNPGFESGTVKWSGSGGTFTINSTAADQFVAGSKQFAVWDSDGAAQERCSALVKVPESGNCAVSLTYKVPSGTATHKIVAKDGSKDLSVEDVVSSTAAWRHDVEFPCAAAASNQARVCLRSVASNEPAIQLDGGYAGEARNVGVADYIGPVESYTPSLLTSGGGSITLNATSQVAINGKKQRIGSNLFISASFRNGSGGAASGSAGTMLITIPSECVPDTSQMVTSVAGVRKLGDSISGTTGAGTEGTAYYYGGQNLAILSNGVTNPLTVADVASSFFLNFNAIIPCTGWAASQVVMPDAQGWWAAANIQGANPSLGVATVTSYTEITASALTMTPKSGSAPIAIMCSGTNAATAPTTSTSTCAAGNESLGANFNIPRSGAYEVCTNFGTYQMVDSGEAVEATFQVIQTPLNAQTISQEGGARTPNGLSGMSVGGGLDQINEGSVHNCGIFNFSAGNVGVRLMYEQSVTGSPDLSLILTDGGVNNGQRDFFISVKPVTAQQQAILANSVSSSVTNGARMIWASVKSVCSASPCTIGSQSGDFTSITRSSTGAYQANFNAGTFSGIPVCTCSTVGSLDGHCSAYNSTTSNSTVRTYTPTGSAQDGYIEMMCIGPR